MITHVFSESLARSHTHAAAPWWEEVYREAWPSFVAMQSVREDGWAQRGGIDRLVTLADGTVLKVDEKVREKDWPDIALEIWSDRDRKVRGWAVKPLTCDFIAYAFAPSATCYLLPFQTLRRAWRLNRNEWWAGCEHILARNNGYVTESVAVPIPALLAAVADAMVIRWGAEEQAA